MASENDLVRTTAAPRFWLAVTFSNLKISTKLLIILVAVATLSAGAFGIMEFRAAKEALREESFNKLTAVRELKAQQVEDYFKTISNQVVAFSESRTIVEAMLAFRETFKALESDAMADHGAEIAADPELIAYYRDEYFARLEPNTIGELDDVEAVSFIPKTPQARHLQELYLAENPNPTGEKHKLDDAGDGSGYSAAHRVYHPIIRSFLEKFGYYDIFLIDPDSGEIVYSVFKEVDYGTSLLAGPYKDTNFAAVFRAARDAAAGDFVRLEDFEPYYPSYNAPASFIGSPIFDGGEKIGVLVFQMPIDRINNIMTSQQAWKNVGLGDSGETYIVGDDFLMRNQSRFLLEDRENYLDMIRSIGVPEDTVRRIATFNSSIGLQKVETEGTRQALSGWVNTEIFPDYRGVPVLSSYRPLGLSDVRWVIMSEIDEAEAFAPVEALKTRMLLLMGLFLAAILGISFVFAKTMTRPIKVLTAKAESLAKGDLGVVIDTGGGDEISHLARSFDVMREALRELIEGLEDRVRERTAELEKNRSSLRLALDQLESVNSVILRWNPDGLVTGLNSFGQELFGFTESEIVGQSVVGTIVPDDEGADDFLRGMIDDILTHPENYLENENKNIRKDGSTFWMMWRNKPIVAEDGSLEGIVSIGIDMTERKKAEEALQDSETRIRTIIENMADGIIVIGEDGVVQSFSPAAERIFGYESDEVIGMKVNMLMPEPMRSEHDHYLEKYVETGESRIVGKNREVIGLRKDATEFPMDLAVGEAVLGNERIFTGIIRDITERKKAERAIEEAITKLQVALSSMSDGIYILDSDLKFIAFNQRYIDLLNFPEGIVKEGQSIAVTVKFAAERGDYGSQFEGSIDDIVAARLEQIKSQEHTRIENVTPDGRIVEYIGSRTSGGGTVVILRDITERKQSEKAIADQLALVEALVDTLPNPVFVRDPETRYTILNKAFLKSFGIEREDLIGKTDMDLERNPIELRRELQQEAEELVRTGGMIRKETTREYADGKIHDVLYWETAFKLSDGNVGGLVGIHVDVTELKELERKAEAANRAKSAFLANMSHELRTPMNAIIGYSEMLAEDAEDEENEDALADLNKIIAAGKHLLTLINDVLDLSKIEAGKMELYTEDFDVNETLNDVTSMAMSLIEKKSNTLATDYGENLGVMHSDMTKIRQNLFNLISNAAKFTENGTITLYAHREARDASDWLVFKVTDTGIGIPEEKLGEIFQEFSQADEATTRHFGGTGLGLTLAKRFTEMMGGRIWAESVLGEGSSFIMELPATVQAEDETKLEAEKVEAEVKADEYLGSDTILVVDDDAAARDIMRRNLEREGYRVITAKNGEEGIDLAKKHTPALITLDVMMPGLDGWAVLSRLKDDPETEDIPVIMVSMLAEEGIGASLGALEHLRKPVDRDELRKVIVKHYQKAGRALIVEDDDATRQIVTKALKAEKWEVAQATNGQEALEIVEREKLDLIILDILMPVMDGFEFLQNFRRMGDKGHVPVVVLTAKDLTKKEKETLSSMATAVLTKSENKIDDLILNISEFMSPSDAKISVEQSKVDGE